MPRDIGVIIVAAGDGRRFGGALRKQYQLLAGVPILHRSLRPFLQHGDVAQVVLVLPPDDVEHPPGWLAPLIGGPLRVTAGGAVRSASVRAGLAALDSGCEVVLVHDGARPLVPAALIDAVIRAVRAGTSAIPALPLTDTLKRADAAGRVMATVPRDGLWRVQTPQGFPREAFARALAAAGDDAGLTDDAMMMEAIGAPVTIIPGADRNLKITHPGDLAIAEWYLEQP